MTESILLEDHQVIYIENGAPLWFTVVAVDSFEYDEKISKLDIVLAQGNTEDEAIQSLRDIGIKGSVVRIRPLKQMLTTAKVLVSMRKALGKD